MLDTVTIEEIDQLLNELEELAHSSTSRKLFFDSTLERLRFLLDARNATVAVQLSSQKWVPVATLGAHALLKFEREFAQRTGSEAYVHASDHSWLAVPIRQASSASVQWQRGALLVELKQPAHQSDITDLVKLCNAFAEILAIRHSAELEKLLDEKWASLQRSVSSLSACTSKDASAYAVVNDLATLVQADRVSLTQPKGLSAARVAAISGVIKVQGNAAEVVAIEKLCREAVKSKRPVASHARQRDSQQGSATGIENYVCVPFPSQVGGSKEGCDSALLFEWKDHDSFLQGCTTLNYVLPAFVAGWQQQQRWIRVPRFVRRAINRPGGRVVGQFSKVALRWSVFTAIALIAFWALQLPSTLRIEAQGTLQPTEQRAVFAAVDGVVERVFVEDGQQVQAGQPLVQMRSTMLEIQIQEVLGDIDANAKKRDGLNVAINQLTSDDANAYAMQSRFSSEIQELQTQLKTLESKQQALEKERAKLQINSPIDGVVVGHQIERYLDTRPVKRGDPLLRVVRLDGPWHLELQVADQDSGYVKRKLFEGQDAERLGSGNVPTESDRKLQFVYASEPDVEQAAQAEWLSESARNPKGDGMFVDVIASVDQEAAHRAHMGATVYAYFDCGERPFWFVWTRPFIEAVQRKIWF